MLALGAIAIWRFDAGNDSPAARLQSLAILPFDAVGIAPESTYFADGVTEEIIDAVGRIPGLRVISRTSAFAFKEKRGLTLRQIADSLKVGAILEGSVRRDVFAVQNEIARDIANLSVAGRSLRLMDEQRRVSAPARRCASARASTIYRTGAALRPPALTRRRS
jgi:hypothetical protein